MAVVIAGYNMLEFAALCSLQHGQEAVEVFVKIAYGKTAKEPCTASSHVQTNPQPMRPTYGVEHS